MLFAISHNIKKNYWVKCNIHFSFNIQLPRGLKMEQKLMSPGLHFMFKSKSAEARGEKN